MQLKDIYNVDYIIIAIAHDEFKKLKIPCISVFYRSDINDNEKVLIYVKGLYKIDDLNKSWLRYWRL